MTVLLTLLHIVVCLVLILVILLQAGRGQGLTNASFGSGNVQTLFGTKAADFMTKATTVAAICFILTSIGLDFLEVRKSKSLLELSSKQAPVDIEQIKDALARVKEKAGDTAETASVNQVAAQAASVEVAAQKAVSDAVAVVDEASQSEPVDAIQEEVAVN